MEKCEIKNCRNVSNIIVVGHGLCNFHWELYCDWQDEYNDENPNIEGYLRFKNGTKKRNEG